MADARRPGWARSLLIYAAGFKGSAKRLRHRNGCRLYVRATHGEALELNASTADGLEAVGARLFGRSELPVYFFGDLDFSGMQILTSLREVFAQAHAWKPGYGELISVLSSGGGHSPEMASRNARSIPARRAAILLMACCCPACGSTVDLSIKSGSAPLKVDAVRGGRRMLRDTHREPRLLPGCCRRSGFPAAYRRDTQLALARSKPIAGRILPSIGRSGCDQRSPTVEIG